MKTASLYIALGAAHLVLCAPTTGVSTDPQSNDPDAVAAPRTWTTYLDENEAAGRDRHDPISRPDPSPFASDDGDAPAPLSGKWELDSGSPAQLGEQPPPTELSRVPHSALDEDDEVWELLEGLEGATPPRAGMPCHHGPSSRERNDMLVVFLAAAFMVAVVVMETWGRLFRRHGAIRLEETTNQAPVSIRAMSEEQIGIGDEKRRV
ncbi:hypothetical protein N658DRAFT_506406 [Parathielavia hyrcaniae]|uniref:Transmembrane protein n=1 Tax=Parathielavia hyrcaniae TaxID=113614 RepID=A0AAN6T301_9PEZI|nr:hypothetical protein N658DRAFT_506406 [Parathielavia hyrcaniae]